MNPREEIIGLMRGFYALPVVSFLGTSGALERIGKGAFAVADFEDLMTTDRLGAIFRYLARLGLLEALDGERFSATALGATVFKRFGSFCIVRSYEEYFRTLENQLHAMPGDYAPKVDRRLNVIGSGQIHGKKFFGAALEILDERPVDILIDVGCGDGAFAAAMAERHKNIKIYAVDAAPEALEETVKRLGKDFPATPVETVLSDAREAEHWLAPVKADADTRIVVSFWFLLHEISGGDVTPVLELLSTIHGRFPQAEIVIGEIIDGGIEALAENRSMTIMPEYLLFHELSGQGPFSVEQINELIASSPYEKADEKLFDVVEHAGEKVPSNSVIRLTVK